MHTMHEVFNVKTRTATADEASVRDNILNFSALSDPKPEREQEEEGKFCSI
jgi:hypothetical protein